MPRFFTHLRNGLGFTEDEEGKDFASSEAAKAAAIEGGRAIMSAEVAEGRLDLRGQLELTDDQGGLVTVVHFSDIVEIVSGELPGHGGM